MKHILLTFLTLMVTTGCSVSPKYHVTLDAITAQKSAIAPSSYETKALDANKDSNSLIFQKYSSKLAEVLEKKGYTKTTNGEVAKQTIYFNYGMEKVGEETQTYSEPNISVNIGYGYGQYYNRPFYSPFYDPFYGRGFGTGYSTYRKTHTYYNRYVTLLAKDQMNKELWRVDVSSVGESKNLRKIIPLLIEASQPYLGTNTAEPIKLIVKEKAQKK